MALNEEKNWNTKPDTQGNHHVTTEAESGARNAKDASKTKSKGNARKDSPLGSLDTTWSCRNLDFSLLVYRIVQEEMSAFFSFFFF